MHILKRKNTYYYKLKIPKDIRLFIAQVEVRFSLRTHSKREALYLSSLLTSRYFTLFSKLRTGIYNEKEVTHLLSTNIYFERLYQKEGQLNLNNSPISPLIKTLEELSVKYSEDKIITNTWTEKTHKAYLFVFMVFSKVIDVSRDVKKVTREELQLYKSVLVQLPILKPNHYDLTLEEILKLDNKIISVSTANKYLSYIVSFFKWCEAEGYIEKSLAVGLSIKENKNTKSRPRVHYLADDLNQLFMHSTLYTKNLNRSLSEHPERVFIPLVALYQGMRVNEIAQLYIEDIKVVDGVYCIDINRAEEGKRLKNESSVRLIPVHAELIELGFIDFYKKQKRSGEIRLWSKLTLGLEGYSTNFRKWFGTFNRKEITEDRTKKFHSFRHLFSHTFRQLSLQDDIDHFAIKYLLGHSVSEDITVDVYSHGYSMDGLAEVLNKLTFEGLDLEELKKTIRSYRG